MALEFIDVERIVTASLADLKIINEKFNENFNGVYKYVKMLQDSTQGKKLSKEEVMDLSQKLKSPMTVFNKDFKFNLFKLRLLVSDLRRIEYRQTDEAIKQRISQLNNAINSAKDNKVKQRLQQEILNLQASQKLQTASTDLTKIHSVTEEAYQSVISFIKLYLKLEHAFKGFKKHSELFGTGKGGSYAKLSETIAVKYWEMQESFIKLFDAWSVIAYRRLESPQLYPTEKSFINSQLKKSLVNAKLRVIYNLKLLRNAAMLFYISFKSGVVPNVEIASIPVHEYTPLQIILGIQPATIFISIFLGTNIAMRRRNRQIMKTIEQLNQM